VVVQPSASANTEAPSTAGPRLECPEPEYDFGEKNDVYVVEHTFKLRNAGDAPLTINRVKPACGCTVATLSKKTIQPGEQADLHTRLTLRGRRGTLRKRILIESDDPASPRYLLWLKGTIIREIELRPSFINYGATSTNAARQRTVEMLSRRPGVTIASVTSDNPSIAVDPAGLVSNGVTTFSVSTVPPLSRGMVRATITVKTTHPDNHELRLVAVASVMGEVMVIPKEIVFKRRMAGPVNRAIYIRPAMVKEFSVLEVKPPTPECEVNIRKLPGGTHRIDVRGIPVSTALNGKAFEILTTVKGMEHISVPVRIVP